MLFVGQWLPMKGIRYLRDAAVTLLQGDPSMRLVCAGTLTAEPAVLAEFPPEFTGASTCYPRIEPAALAGSYREADVFVFPSLYEAFSRADCRSDGVQAADRDDRSRRRGRCAAQRGERTDRSEAQRRGDRRWRPAAAGGTPAFRRAARGLRRPQRPSDTAAKSPSGNASP